ncbi:MAG: class I SAM-dependent methyltransferase [Dehalococcoidia bacterium]
MPNEGPGPDLAELLDLDYGDFSDDLPFYESIAQRCERPLLELGVGTGRVAIPLARLGYDVWGIDSSEAALARARCKAGPDLDARLRLQQADMREFKLGQLFDLIFAGFGGFHHLLTTEEQLACLRSVERHLAPGGLFLCDLRPISHEPWDAGDSVPLSHDWTRVLPSSGETVIKLRSVRADPDSQVKRDTSIYDTIAPDGAVRRTIHEVDLRFTTRYEMERLLHAAGLEPDQVYGDYDLATYDHDSQYMITVARKQGSRNAS